MAEWVLVTGMAPSEWKALTLVERGKVKEAAQDMADRMRSR